MKKLVVPKLYFYIYITVFVIISYSSIEAFENYFNFACNSNKYNKLRFIKKNQMDIEIKFENFFDKDDEDMIHDDQDFVMEIMEILISMYEKIVSASVSYYILMDLPRQEKLQNIVARIIAQDTLKIINILNKKIINYLFNKDMTWERKILYCAFIGVIIMIIKLGIDRIAQNIQAEKNNIHGDFYENHLGGQENFSYLSRFNKCR
jgi:hypothetical protein